MKTDWKTEMDKQYKEAIKNWYKTGAIKKSSGVSASFNLGSK